MAEPGDRKSLKLFSPDFSSIKPTSAWGFSESKKWGAETTRDHKNRGE